MMKRTFLSSLGIFIILSWLSLTANYQLIVSADQGPIVWHDPQLIYQMELPEKWKEYGFLKSKYAHPRITVANEQCFIVWEDISASMTKSRILFSYFDGTKWRLPIPLSGNESYNHHPSIAVENSRIHVVWSHPDIDKKGDMHIVYRLYDGITWHPETEIGIKTGSSLLERSPQIIAENDHLHLVWAVQNPASSAGLYYRQFDGATWQPPIEIGLTNSSNRQDWPTLVVTNSIVHVVWTELCARSPNTTNHIFYQHFNGDSWQSPELISSFGQYPTIAGGKDNLYVVWEAEDLELKDVWEQHNFDIYYRRFNGITWEMYHGLSPIGPYLYGIWESHVPIIVEQQNQLYVLWFDCVLEDKSWGWVRSFFLEKIMFRYFTGTTWLPEEPIQETVSPYGGGFSMAIDQTTIHIIWESLDETGEFSGLYYRSGTIQAGTSDKFKAFIPGGEGLITLVALITATLYKFKRKSIEEN